jgi:ribulose-phosphate 3-epimerase
MQCSLSILGYVDLLYEKKGVVKGILAEGISYLHIDIMRNNYVGRSAFTYNEIREVCTWHSLLDIHVMARDPKEILGCIEACISGVQRDNAFITLPLEAYSIEGHVNYDKLCAELQYLRNIGFKTGIALEPKTPIVYLQQLLGSLDMVLLMSVKSGAGGQSFNQDVLNKVDAVRNHGKTLAMDGGINMDTLPLVASAGVDIAVVGSCITSSENPLEKAKIIVNYLRT